MKLATVGVAAHRFVIVRIVVLTVVVGVVGTAVQTLLALQVYVNVILDGLIVMVLVGVMTLMVVR